jgi:hypothetical protein
MQYMAQSIYENPEMLGGAVDYCDSFVISKPITTLMMIVGGVTTQYDQKIVLLISRSNASPEAA